MTQAFQIKQMIQLCLDEGMTDKGEIYNRVVDSLAVPRPTVRRVCGEIVREYKAKLKVLKPEEEKI